MTAELYNYPEQNKKKNAVNIMLHSPAIETRKLNSLITKCLQNITTLTKNISWILSYMKETQR